MPGLVECLKGHAGSHRSITNNGDCSALVLHQIFGDGHPQGGGN